MAQKTPEQVIEKYQRGVAGAGQDYANGVQNPSRPWASATAAAAARYAAGVQEAISNGKFQRGVQRAGDAKWQQRASTIGAQRYTGAAGEAAQAFGAVAGQVMQAAAAARQAATAQPNTTFDQRLQRMVAAARATSDFWKRSKS